MSLWLAMRDDDIASFPRRIQTPALRRQTPLYGSCITRKLNGETAYHLNQSNFNLKFRPFCNSGGYFRAMDNWQEKNSCFTTETTGRRLISRQR
jgi:hypothetical protein